VRTHTSDIGETNSGCGSTSNWSGSIHKRETAERKQTFLFPGEQIFSCNKLYLPSFTLCNSEKQVVIYSLLKLYRASMEAEYWLCAPKLHTRKAKIAEMADVTAVLLD